MYPYGDSQSDKTLSVFLCAVDRKQLPGWSQTAHYQIAVVNHKDPSKTSTHTGYDIFRGKRDSAWGWSKLINLSKLHDVSQGWADDDGKITLQATVHVVTHEYMPVKRTYRKSLCGLYYERVLQSYFEPFLKDELQRLDKLCGNSVLHKGFSDFWTALPDGRKRLLLQITMDEVLLNVKARLFSRDQPATYLAADVIFKAAYDCDNGLQEALTKSLVGCTSISVIGDDKEDGGTVLRLERVGTATKGHDTDAAGAKASAATTPAAAAAAPAHVMLRTHKGVVRMSNSANFVDVFRSQVSDALDNVRALVKHLKPQSCDGSCLEAMGRQILAVFAMCGMYITNVHPAYHEKLALQLQEDLIREEEEKSLKADAKKAKQAEKRKKQSEAKAAKRAEEEAAKKKAEEDEKRRKEEAKAEEKRRAEENAKKKAEARKKAQEEAEAKRKKELEAEEKRKQEEADRRAAEEAARHEAIVSHLEDDTDKGEHVDVTAQNKQIAAIMRDQTLSAVEKQMRTQAIRAGKLDVPAAPSDTTGAAKSAGAVAGDAGSAQWLPPGRPQAPQQMQHSPPRQQQFAAASATLPAANHPMVAGGSGVADADADLDVDVQAFALNLNALTGFTEDETHIDDVMAMATGGHSHAQPYAPSYAPAYSGFGGGPGSSTGPAGSRFFGSGSGLGLAASSGFSTGDLGGGVGGMGINSGVIGGTGSTGSRFFDRWAGPKTSMPFAHGSDEDNFTETSMASTASGTQTPLNLDLDEGMPGSPEIYSESMANACTMSAFDFRQPQQSRLLSAQLQQRGPLGQPAKQTPKKQTFPQYQQAPV